MAQKAGIALLLVALCACGRGPTQVSHSDRGAYEGSLVPIGHGFVAAWYDSRDGNAEIYMRSLDAAGRPAGAERRLTFDKAQSYEPDAISFDRDIVIAWYEREANGTLRPWVGRWSRAGERRWRTPLAAAGRNAIVRRAGERLFCAWIDARGRVLGAWLDAAGALTAEPFRLGDAGATTWNLNAAVDGNGVPWVVFDAKAGTRAEELFMVRADDFGGVPIMLTANDGAASKYPDIAFNGTTPALAWYDERDGNKEVYLAAGETLRAQAIDAAATRVTRSPGESIGAYLTWVEGRIAVAWSEEIDRQHEVQVQLFDREAKPATQPQRVTRTAARSLIPAIKPWGRNLALAWNEYTPGDSSGHGDTGSRSEISFTVVRP